MERPYKSQFISFIVTIFASLITVQYLYTITHQRELLCAAFLLIYIIAHGSKDWITRSLYPDRADHKVEHRRMIMLMACDLVINIAVVVISKLVFDMFVSFRVKVNVQWWEYITLVALGLTFVFEITITAD